MPVILDPNQKLDVVLKSDRDKSPAPTFHFRHLDGRRWLKFAEGLDELRSADAKAGNVTKIYEILRLTLTGWSDMLTGDASLATEFGAQPPVPGQSVALPYKPELLDALVGPREAKELIDAVVAGAVGRRYKKILRLAANLRVGSLCDKCTSTSCVDKPRADELSSVNMECMHCDGLGGKVDANYEVTEPCEFCGGAGEFKISDCPYKLIDKPMSALLQSISWMERGILPVAGGSLDQAKWFMEAAAFLKNDEANIREEINANAHHRAKA